MTENLFKISSQKLIDKKKDVKSADITENYATQTAVKTVIIAHRTA